MRRALVAGGRLAFFDVLTGEREPLHLPVPWAGMTASCPWRRRRSCAYGCSCRVRDPQMGRCDRCGRRLRRRSASDNEPARGLGPQIVVPDMADRAPHLSETSPRAASPSSNASPARCEVSNLRPPQNPDQATNAGSPVTSSTVVGRATCAAGGRGRRVDDFAVDEELAAPHAERFAALQSGREAQAADGATGADRLGPSSLRRVLGEEQGCVRGARIGATGRLGDHDIHRMTTPRERRLCRTLDESTCGLLAQP